MLLDIIFFFAASYSWACLWWFIQQRLSMHSLKSSCYLLLPVSQSSELHFSTHWSIPMTILINLQLCHYFCFFEIPQVLKQTTPSTDESINDKRVDPTQKDITDVNRCNVFLTDVWLGALWDQVKEIVSHLSSGNGIGTTNCNNLSFGIMLIVDTDFVWEKT